ncbi:Venom carboxylesterase-6 [Orchesella cincta]|uniref:Carboxylic ester hydrolase n=1 Tax=Orchesella cincta TaxID=48709 RepID=A0A1D2MEB5_ORCCI|nr:Venom carboxylesterase-6 [Orchesella cincta]
MIGLLSLLVLLLNGLQVEFGFIPPFIFINPGDNRLLSQTPSILPSSRSRQGRNFGEDDNGPTVHTELGSVRGFQMKISDSREIFAFTGVPFGETTGGANRFRDPIPKKAWKGTLDATRPSPFCVQAQITAGLAPRGEDNCLYLDIFTPSIFKNSTSSLLPVIVWIPAGAHLFGRSRYYGPKYIMREDVIYVPINFRMGIFGYLTTGDENAPGNWALKDQALAVEWVHKHIQAFGGDPNKITIGGISSGAATAHLMAFAKNHNVRNLLKGIIMVSGTSINNFGFDGEGNVRKASDGAAQRAGCPTSSQNSTKMIECLQKMDPYLLLALSFQLLPKIFQPTIEPDVPSAFISERPEDLYRQGKVAPIPMIITRSLDETRLQTIQARYTLLQMITPIYFRFLPTVLHLGMRAADKNVSIRKYQQQFVKQVHELYFNRTTRPNFLIERDFSSFCDMLDDALFIAPTWKTIEFHHKIAPTFVYIFKLETVTIHPVAKVISIFNKPGAQHGSEFMLLFNNSRMMPDIQPGSDFDKASKNLINMLVNFAAYGVPLYRTQTGRLLDLWKPVKTMSDPVALEVGLVKNIRMIRDPVVAQSERWRIWEQVAF